MDINLIKIGKRQREHEDLDTPDFQTLKTSIQTSGLIQPIAVSESNQLISGYRRLTACKELGWAEIPVHIIDIGGREQERLLLEYMENVTRKDFTWQESLRAKFLIYTTIRKEKPGFKAKHLALILQQGEAWTSQELLIAAYSRDHPEVLSCATESAAYLEACKSRVVELTKESLSRTEDETVTITEFQPAILYSEALEMLASMKEHSVDVCVTDPPFGLEIQGRKWHKQQVTYYKDDYTDTRTEYIELIMNVVKGLKRIMKPGAHVYMFCAIQYYDDLYNIYKSFGFSPLKMPMFWYYSDGHPGITAQPYYIPGNKYETILMAFAPGNRRKLELQGLGNILAYERLPVGTKIHPLEKPVELYSDLLKRSSAKGDVMIDPFCGTGASQIAGMKLGLRCHGAEILEKYRVIAEKRVIKLQKGN